MQSTGDASSTRQQDSYAVGNPSNGDGGLSPQNLASPSDSGGGGANQWPFSMMDQGLLHKVSPGLFPLSPPGMLGGNGFLPLPRDVPPQRMQSPLMYSGPVNPNLLHPTPMVAGFVSPALGPADWQNQFLHVANLQKMTAGFLSPAGHPAVPMSPIVRHPRYGPSPPAQQGDAKASASGAATPTRLKQVDQSPGSPTTAARSGRDERTPSGEAADSAEFGHHLMRHPANETANWLGFNGPLSFPYVGGFAPPGSPTGSQGYPGSAEVQSGKQASNDENEGALSNMLQAKEISDRLLHQMSAEKAIKILQAALVLLDRTAETDPQKLNGGDKRGYDATVDVTSLPSVKLVHPDDFKNPSTFLKIYGDPLCFTKTGPLPKKDRNGNWECSKCNNVNFPRRFRCNMCTAPRDAEGDWVVSEYARQVYERYLYLYRNQRGNNNDISIPVPDVHHARRYAAGGGGIDDASSQYNTYDGSDRPPPQQNQNRRRRYHHKGGGSTRQSKQQNAENGKHQHDARPQPQQQPHPFATMKSEDGGQLAKSDYSKGFQSAVY